MAYGTTSDFSVTRDEIIAAAMRLCGIMDPDETPSETEVANASQALNMMIKTWMADGFHLWTISEAILFLEAKKDAYKLGGITGDHVSFGPSFTTLTENASSGAISVTVNGVLGISVGDYIGLVLDDNTTHWTTVSEISGTTITLTSELTSTASSGNPVYTHPDYISRPLQVFSARIVLDEFHGTEVPLIQLSEEEYKEIPNKYIDGRPTSFWYDPLVHTSGYLYLWPVPNSVRDFLKISYQFPIYDFDSASNTPHFPVEWSEALKFNLAVRIAPEYGVKMEDRLWLKQEATELLDKLLAWDREHTSIFIYPLLRGGR